MMKRRTWIYPKARSLLVNFLNPHGANIAQRSTRKRKAKNVSKQMMMKKMASNVHHDQDHAPSTHVHAHVQLRARVHVHIHPVTRAHIHDRVLFQALRDDIQRAHVHDHAPAQIRILTRVQSHRAHIRAPQDHFRDQNREHVHAHAQKNVT